MGTQRKSRSRGGLKPLTGVDVENQLQVAERIKAELERMVPKPVQSKQEVFNISVADGQVMTGCGETNGVGDERSLLQWSTTNVHKVLAQKNEPVHESYLYLLEAQRAALLAQKVKTPLESLLVLQSLLSHELACHFAKRSLAVEDVTLSSKLAARYAQLATLACHQAESIQRLRGEAGQKVTVTRLTVEEGGQAVVGHVHPRSNPGEGAKK